jgi:predicted transcriptional regulator
MSTYIQIPNSITQLTNRCKHEEALVYAIIRNEIKDKSLKASIPEKQIADIINMTERTVNSYVSDLKNVGLLNEPERKQGKSEYPYNVYQFSELNKDYFVVLPPFLADINISPKLKGLLLFIKANCWSGTNYIRYNGITTDLAEKLGVGKNQIKDYVTELQVKGYVRFIGKSLHIINENFPLFQKANMWNITYQIIYDYCLEHDRVPPIKKLEGHHKDEILGYIIAEYATDYDRLRNTLNERCKNLPADLSLEYFCQVLRNKKPQKDDKTYCPIIL